MKNLKFWINALPFIFIVSLLFSGFVVRGAEFSNTINSSDCSACWNRSQFEFFASSLKLEKNLIDQYTGELADAAKCEFNFDAEFYNSQVDLSRGEKRFSDFEGLPESFDLYSGDPCAFSHLLRN